MHKHRIAAALTAAAAFGVLGAAPAVAATPAPPPGSGPCALNVSLTGFTGRTLTAGGPAVNGTVVFKNVSGKALPKYFEGLTSGQIKDDPVKPYPNKVVVVEAEHDGTWSVVPYRYQKGDPYPFLPLSWATGSETLKAGNVDTVPLRLSVPKGAPAGTYQLTGVAFSAQPTGSTAHTSVPPSGSGCYGTNAAAYNRFTVVAAPEAGASATPTPAPSATGTGLADTGGGSDTGLLIGSGVALVVLGGGALAFTRRRGSRL
ncbi:LAETG motif-containing sortase-dependent surface protein [Streptacidiphilus jiangxiensis]|uniref:LPXTG-motif cell wall anchor domain-containing protein n=1 Tax=Streptacidiphilus jiangxiensis TaxID=235985 RepID=A0A1H7MGD3_STRJI|nr:LAETG motif-containing sortase-dependent surface protein [Streptacidiphilus jiangxiensis]SEL09745.1 hypothetical protein SAMN05414137_105348 [Streptacidiphilus jiangxiensis]